MNENGQMFTFNINLFRYVYLVIFVNSGFVIITVSFGVIWYMAILPTKGYT